MNYANMIEEKHLKRTLISTVIGTFTTSIGLYERVRDRHNQHKTDHSQDEKIKRLERRADAEERARRRDQEKHEQAMSNQQHPQNQQHQQNQSPRAITNGNWDNNGNQYPALPYYQDGQPRPSRPQNDLRDALAVSGPLIRREYDRNYARLGPRFAEGDQIAQNEIQAQIIDLQASVIRLLQDAVVTGTLPDPAVLYAAAGRARHGSIRALQDQYQRMLVAAPVSHSSRALRSSSVASSSTRSSHAVAGYDRRRITRDFDRESDRESDRDRFREQDRDQNRGRRSLSQVTNRRASTFPVQPPPAQSPLFCRYAIQLQKDWHRPLDMSGDARNDLSESDGSGDDLICPACMGQFAIEPDSSWKMHKPVVVGEQVEEIVNRDSKAGDGDRGGSDRDGSTSGRVDPEAADGKVVTTRRRNIVELVQDRKFMVSNRFIVKCHRPAVYDAIENMLLPPTYACLLCDRFDGDRVAMCGTMTRLINHVCEKHSVGELLSDPDIRELRTPPRKV